MRRIVLPQAARVIVPPLGNEFNNMLKTTSLLVFIGVVELLGTRRSTTRRPSSRSSTSPPSPSGISLLTTIWTLIQAWIERRLAASERDEAALTTGERMADAWSPMSYRGRA